MSLTRNTVLGLTSFLAFLPALASAKGACDTPSLMKQKRDEATIQQLETAWNTAIAQGDVDFEGCLLSADFLEILSTGELKTRTYELGMTGKNKGQNKPNPDMPAIEVLLHGNVAVAHAIWKSAGGKPDRNADYFVWEDGQWHIFFSQGTPVEK